MNFCSSRSCICLSRPVFILSGQNFANYGYLKKSAHLTQLVLSSSRPCEDTFVLGISKGGSYAVIHVCFDDGSERQCVRPDQSFVIISRNSTIDATGFSPLA